MFVYHFVDLYMRVEIFLEKEGPGENGGVDFEIENISTSANLYWRLKKISSRVCLLFLGFLLIKNIF